MSLKKHITLLEMNTALCEVRIGGLCVRAENKGALNHFWLSLCFEVSNIAQRCQSANKTIPDSSKQGAT